MPRTARSSTAGRARRSAGLRARADPNAGREPARPVEGAASGPRARLPDVGGAPRCPAPPAERALRRRLGLRLVGRAPAAHRRPQVPGLGGESEHCTGALGGASLLFFLFFSFLFFSSLLFSL